MPCSRSKPLAMTTSVIVLDIDGNGNTGTFNSTSFLSSAFVASKGAANPNKSSVHAKIRLGRRLIAIDLCSLVQSTYDPRGGTANRSIVLKKFRYGFSRLNPPGRFISESVINLLFQLD